MNKKIPLVLVVCMIILGTVPTTMAVTGHNLEWGFEVGDQFHYSYSDPRFLGSRVDFYVEIDVLPEIQEDVDTFYGIYGSLSYSQYFENGTELPFMISWGALPIGNWSLIQELYDNSTVLEYQWIDTATEWGFIYIEEYTTDTNITATTTIKFSKTDGALNLYQLVVDPDIGLSITSQVARKGLGTGIELYLIIAGVAAVVVVAGIAIVVMKKR